MYNTKIDNSPKLTEKRFKIQSYEISAQISENYSSTSKFIDDYIQYRSRELCGAGGYKRATMKWYNLVQQDGNAPLILSQVVTILSPNVPRYGSALWESWRKDTEILWHQIIRKSGWMKTRRKSQMNYQKWNAQDIR